MVHGRSFVLPLVVAASMFAAACGPAAAPAPTAAPAAPAAQPTTAAAANPTTAPGAPAAAAQPTQAPTTQPAAGAAGKPVKGGTLTVATERDATTFDPTKSQDVYSNAIIGLTADSLYRINDKAEVVGD